MNTENYTGVTSDFTRLGDRLYDVDSRFENGILKSVSLLRYAENGIVHIGRFKIKRIFVGKIRFSVPSRNNSPSGAPA